MLVTKLEVKRGYSKLISAYSYNQAFPGKNKWAKGSLFIFNNKA